MPMRYAHAADLLSQLKIKPEDTAATARVERLENGLAAAFDEKVGTSFGVAPVAETRNVYGDGGHLLRLEPRARSVELVAMGGTWDGLVWTDETVLEASDWSEVWDRSQAAALYAHGFAWIGPVRVTAVWDDQPAEAVPDDVRSAMTFLTVDEYRVQESAPTGEVGRDGLAVHARNPWRFEIVKAAIANHRVRRMRVGV